MRLGSKHASAGECNMTILHSVAPARGRIPSGGSGAFFPAAVNFSASDIVEYLWEEAFNEYLRSNFTFYGALDSLYLRHYDGYL